MSSSTRGNEATEEASESSEPDDQELYEFLMEVDQFLIQGFGDLDEEPESNEQHDEELLNNTVEALDGLEHGENMRWLANYIRANFGGNVRVEDSEEIDRELALRIVRGIVVPLRNASYQDATLETILGYVRARLVIGRSMPEIMRVVDLRKNLPTGNYTVVEHGGKNRGKLGIYKKTMEKLTEWFKQEIEFAFSNVEVSRWMQKERSMPGMRKLLTSFFAPPLVPMLWRPTSRETLRTTFRERRNARSGMVMIQVPAVDLVAEDQSLRAKK